MGSLGGLPTLKSKCTPLEKGHIYFYIWGVEEELVAWIKYPGCFVQ